MTDPNLVTTQATRGLSSRVMSSLSGAAARVGIDPLALRLVKIKRWLKDDVAELERRLGTIVQAPLARAEADLAEQAAHYLLQRPGKRVRPLCVVLAARLGGRRLDGAVTDVAISAELVHAATLLHDDVIDLGTERRGAPAARVVFGNSVSILGGDHLLIEALRLVDEAGGPILLRGLLETVSAMVAAEAIQLACRGRFEPDRDVYLEVVRGKTAALFRWALGAGGRLGNLDAQNAASLEQIGEHLGLAFQLTDDCLDLSEARAATGKDLFADIREGKLTWPLILASERDPWVADQLREQACSGAPNEPAALRAIAQRVRASGALETTRAYAAEQVARAAAALEPLPAGRARRAIAAVLQAVIRRKS